MDVHHGRRGVSRFEANHNKSPTALRSAILKRADGNLTPTQREALAELEASDLLTAIAWQVKEMLRWVRRADSVQVARWRITNILRYAMEVIGSNTILDPVRTALGTFERHRKRILERWESSHSNTRLEGLNGLLMAARSPARGYL